MIHPPFSLFFSLSLLLHVPVPVVTVPPIVPVGRKIKLIQEYLSWEDSELEPSDKSDGNIVEIPLIFTVKQVAHLKGGKLTPPLLAVVVDCFFVASE